MKRTFICTLLACFALTTSAQIKFEETFQIQGTQSELFTASRQFVTKFAANPNYVNQNDDREGGIIQLKMKAIGRIDYSVMGMAIPCEYYYNYLVTIRVKDGKARCTVSDIVYDRMDYNGNGNSMPPIHPFLGDENCPPKSQTKFKPAKVCEMMREIMNELQEIPKVYKQFMNLYKTDDDF
ncbi:MAG: DUF4468 domain-containing protein [Bacteroidaceae bacterium]|nr:DUF4468 domain-containing protein [Bacteroidaceae bacterium]